MRKPDAIVKLRYGCFPDGRASHPPHDYLADGDGLYVKYVEPEQYDRLPVVTDIHGRTQDIEQMALWQLRTGGNWCLYIPAGNAHLLQYFLALAGAGRGGVEMWMRGYSYMEARGAARDAHKARQEELQQRREQASRRLTSANLDDLDIEI